MSDDLANYPRPYAEQQPRLQIPLIAWFYAVALIAVCLATIGGVPGAVVGGAILAAWAILLSPLTVIEKIVIAAVVLILLGLLLPAIQNERPYPRRAHCQNNLKQLALALHTYHSVHGRFPPAYVLGPDGKPWHSWRVLILPHVEEQNRYARYRFDEPWDGPNNRQLADGMPSVFACPAHADGEAGQTSYFAIVGPDTMWPGERSVRIDDIRDGTTNTLALIEWSGRKVAWMEPSDPSEAEVVQFFSRSDPPDVAHPGAACTAVADGSVQSLEFGLNPEFVASRCKIDDGPLPPRTQHAFSQSLPTLPPPWSEWFRGARWILLLVISLLPAPWALARMMGR